MLSAFASSVQIMAHVSLNKEGSKPINRFLMSSRKAALASTRQRAKVEVYLGNEACDVDSMVSSIALAMMSQAISSSSVAVPVLNIQRSDLSLRPEAVLLFKLLDIDISRLTFIDEIDLNALHDCESLSLMLVDHNVLAVSQRHLASSVTGIVDHHHDVGYHLNVSPRVVATCGSCSTLVTSSFLFTLPPSSCILNPSLAILLISAILLDTRNLKQRATETDIQVANKLADVAGLTSPGATTELFTLLNTRKYDQDAFTTYDLLRKDFKFYDMSGYRIGISSAGVEFRTWSQRHPQGTFGIGKEHFEKFSALNDLDLLIVMSAFEDDGVFKRQLLLFPCAREGRGRGIEVKQLISYLQQDDFEFGLKLRDEIMMENRAVVFDLSNVAISRKRLAPVLEGFFAA